MRKILFIALLLAGMSISAQVSTTKLQKVYDLDAGTESKAVYKETSSTAIYHGENYPVFMTSKGKLFIWVISKKSGKKYKKYINT